MLKKHSTSSVLLARGCSIGRLVITHSRLCHSLPSILVISADKVSLENPSTFFKLLHVTNNTNRHKYSQTSIAKTFKGLTLHMDFIKFLSLTVVGLTGTLCKCIDILENI